MVYNYEKMCGLKEKISPFGMLVLSKSVTWFKTTTIFTADHLLLCSAVRCFPCIEILGATGLELVAPSSKNVYHTWNYDTYDTMHRNILAMPVFLVYVTSSLKTWHEKFSA